MVCTAPEPLLRQRLLERAAAGSDPSDATVEVLQSQHQWIEPLEPDEKGLVMAVPGAAN